MRRAVLAMLTWTKNIIVTAFLLLFFAFTWVGLAVPMMGMMYGEQKRPVGNEVPENFPYLVLTPAGEGIHTPWILLHRELEAFKTEHPDYTFLVPDDERSRVAEILGERRVGEPGERFSRTMALVQGPEDGPQNLQVLACVDDDDENMGWYEATDKDAFPAHHESYSRSSVATRATIAATAINFGGWAVLVLVYRSNRKRRLAGKVARAAA